MFKTVISIVIILSNTICYLYGQRSLIDIPFADSIKSINFIHLSKSINATINSVIDENQVIGQVAPYPNRLSAAFDNEIEQSKKYYAIGDFLSAKKVLEQAILSDPNNSFILYYYARACYQVDKMRSFETYQKLINILDSTYHSTRYDPSIDLWFIEAYYKVGTLYMDNKSWSKAYFEISRFMFFLKGSERTAIYSQALEFLTECAYNLYYDKIAKHLAQRTLYYDPTNQYAKSILIKLNK